MALIHMLSPADYCCRVRYRVCHSFRFDSIVMSYNYSILVFCSSIMQSDQLEVYCEIAYKPRILIY